MADHQQRVYYMFLLKSLAVYHEQQPNSRQIKAFQNPFLTAGAAVGLNFKLKSTFPIKGNSESQTQMTTFTKEQLKKSEKNYNEQRNETSFYHFFIKVVLNCYRINENKNWIFKTFKEKYEQKSQRESDNLSQTIENKSIGYASNIKPDC